jgi:hypothetical protein
MIEMQNDPDEAGAIRLVLSDRSDSQNLRLWFPEIIWRNRNQQQSLGDNRTFEDAFDSYALYSKQEESWRSTKWESEGCHVFQRTLDFGDGIVKAKATSDADGINMELLLCNKSNEIWIDCYSEICLQLANASDFADFKRNRTYGRTSGKWHTLDTTPLATPNPQRNSYNATPTKPFLWETIRGWWINKINVTLDHPVIFVQNSSGDAIIGIGFKPCVGYCNNLDPNMACIHSDPFMGNITPGHTKTVSGRIFYNHGSVEDFVAKLNNLYSTADQNAGVDR